MIEMIDIRNRLASAEVRSLLDQLEYPLEVRKAKTEEIIREYRKNLGQVILGAELNGELTGFIGLRLQFPNAAEIRHIAVRRDQRGKGIGRQMILKVCSTYCLREVSAETDGDAAEFYRMVGFAVENLGEKNSGTDRFSCKLRV